MWRKQLIKNVCKLFDGDEITEEKDAVKKFKAHLEKIVETHKIYSPIFDLSDNDILNIIENFPQHASVLTIKQVRNSSYCFSFKSVTIEYICKEILASDISKATQSDEVAYLTKIIKN